MPQDRKTQAPDLELPDLTDNQLKFVRGILSGLNNSDAYRQAYSTENMARETVWAMASRTRADHKVSAWIDHARAYETAMSAYTLKAHVERLQDLSHKAEKAGNIGAAVQAEKAIGQARGFYSDNPNRDIKDARTPEEILDQLRKASPRGSELAAMLSKGTPTMQ